MSYFDILIRFVNVEDREDKKNPATANDFVVLEQIPFEERDPSGFQSWYRENVGDSSGVPWEQMNTAYGFYNSADCSNGYLEIEIRAHKSKSDLQYKMKKTKGEWQSSVPTTETEQKKVSIVIDNEREHIFSNENVISVVCAEWEGDVFNAYGEIILPKPTISVSTYNPDNEYDTRTRIVVSEKCSGTLRVIKEIEFDTWILLIEPRMLYEGAGSTSGQGAISIDRTVNPNLFSQDGISLPENTGVENNSCSSYYESNDLESAYASTVRAIWDGGFYSLDVEIPKDKLSPNCDPLNDTFASTSVDSGEEGGDCYDLYVVRDKCTNEIISKELRSVPCTSEE